MICAKPGIIEHAMHIRRWLIQLPVIIIMPDRIDRKRH